MGFTRGGPTWLVATALILSSCGSNASPAPTAGPSAQGTPSATAVLPTPVPSTLAVEPVTPTSREVVARLEIGSDIAAPELARVLYADGSLVALRSTTSTVFRLSQTGLTTVVDRFRASGLFAESHAIPPPAVPMGFMIYRLTFLDGGVAVTVSGTNLGDDAEAHALFALGDGLLDAVAWLPLDAFVDGDRRAHPYLAREVRVTSETAVLGEGAWTNAAQHIDRVPWPLAERPEQLGEPLGLPGTERAIRCGIISGADEQAVRAALAALESQSADAGGRTTTWYVWLDAPLLLRLTLHPYLPDEDAACRAEDMAAQPPSLAAAPRPSLRALLEVSTGGVTPAQPEPRMFVNVIDVRDDRTLAHVSYYDDGTVLVRDPPPPAVGIGARRLNGAGLEEVRRTLDESGLLRASWNEIPPEGATWGHTYSIVTSTVILNATDRGVDPKAEAIVALARKLADPTSWLPGIDWVGSTTDIRPYRPAAIRLWVSRQGEPLDPSLPSVRMLAWPLSGTIETFGRLDEELPGTGTRTDSLSVNEALALLRALDTTGARSWGGATRVEYHLTDVELRGVVVFELAIEAGEWGP